MKELLYEMNSERKREAEQQTNIRTMTNQFKRNLSQNRPNWPTTRKRPVCIENFRIYSVKLVDCVCNKRGKRYRAGWRCSESCNGSRPGEEIGSTTRVRVDLRVRVRSWSKDMDLVFLVSKGQGFSTNEMTGWISWGGRIRGREESNAHEIG